MALTIETGAGVAGADSYATVAELRAYAAKRGLTVPSAEGDCEVLLTKALDYIEGQEFRFRGERVQRNQALSWPRYDAYINGFCIGGNAIPAELKNAQIVLAIEAQTLDLMPTVDAVGIKGPITSEKVDVIEVTYAEPAVKRTQTWFAKADALLLKLYRAGGSNIAVARA